MVPKKATSQIINPFPKHFLGEEKKIEKMGKEVKHPREFLRETLSLHLPRVKENLANPKPEKPFEV